MKNYFSKLAGVILVKSAPALHKELPFNVHFIKSLNELQRNRYSGWLLAGRRRGRSSNPDRVKNFSFSTSSRPAVGPTLSPIQWAPGDFSTGVKQPGREADHSAPTSTEVKKTSIYTSTPLYAFMA
jgi:hypothetical protein